MSIRQIRSARCGVPKILKSRESELPINNTVKLTDELRARVAKAMEAGGFTVWSEFCRVALTEKCQTVERDTRERDPVEFSRIFGRDGKYSPGTGIKG